MMKQIGLYEKEINIVLNITNLEALLYIAIYKYIYTTFILEFITQFIRQRLSLTLPTRKKIYI